MKKISITKLEAARLNPAVFAKALKEDEPKGFFGKSQFMDWQRSINEYHKTNDISKSINYLEKCFSTYSNNAKNRKSLEKYLASTEAYFAALKKNGNLYLKQETIQIPLNNKSMISGRVPLTYMNSKGGFSAYFYSKVSADWENELKFPILQDFFGKFYGTDLDKIEVGVFNINTNKFYEKTFSEADVKSAKNELTKIAKIFFDIL